MNNTDTQEAENFRKLSGETADIAFKLTQYVKDQNVATLPKEGGKHQNLNDPEHAPECGVPVFSTCPEPCPCICHAK